MGRGAKAAHQKIGFAWYFPLEVSHWAPFPKSKRPLALCLGLWGHRVCSSPHNSPHHPLWSKGERMEVMHPLPPNGCCTHPQAERDRKAIGATARRPNTEGKTMPKRQPHHLLIRHHVSRSRLNEEPSAGRLEGNLTRVQTEERSKKQLRRSPSQGKGGRKGNGTLAG